MDNQYKINEFAKMINVSILTLQRWDNKGILVAHRTPTNRRFYTHSQYMAYIGEESKGATNYEELETNLLVVTW
jgi:predicted site-specific integrase-resolvase